MGNGTIPEEGPRSLKIPEEGPRSLKIPEEGPRSLKLPEEGPRSLKLPEEGLRSLKLLSSCSEWEDLWKWTEVTETDMNMLKSKIQVETKQNPKATV